MQTPGNLTSGYSTHNAGVLPVVYFDSDDTAYEVVLIDNEVQLKKKIGTSVNSIDAEAGNRTGDFMYTLGGSKVNCQPSTVNSQLKKGIYIVNGKKVVLP